MKPIIFDIEVVPLPKEQLISLMPPFDPAEVKLGNRKEEKAAEYIEQKRQQHEQDFLANAALDPLTGMISVFGASGNQIWLKDGTTEKDILEAAWETIIDTIHSGQEVVGFNILGFDLPYLMKRSWLLGVPFSYRTLKPRGRWWNDSIVDLRLIWSDYDPRAKGTLESIGRAMKFNVEHGTDWGEVFKLPLNEIVKIQRDKNLADIELVREIADRIWA